MANSYPPLQGIPPPRTRPPVEWSLRCLCGRRFVVFDPHCSIVGQAEARARERAKQLKATYVNAHLTPWRYCEDCHQLLIFSPDFDIQESPTIQ